MRAAFAKPALHASTDLSMERGEPRAASCRWHRYQLCNFCTSVMRSTDPLQPYRARNFPAHA
jgi:hypothetical protein